MVIQTSGKRLLVGILIALAIAFVLVTTKASEAATVTPGQVAVNPCRGLTSSDPLWWYMGCYMHALRPVVLVRFH